MVIHVRDSGGTYHARCNGKKATCTAGPQQAAAAVARKVVGDIPHTLRDLGNECQWEIVTNELRHFIVRYRHNGQQYGTVVDAHSVDQARSDFQLSYPHIEVVECFDSSVPENDSDGGKE